MEAMVLGENEGARTTTLDATTWQTFDLRQYAGKYVKIHGTSEFYFGFVAVSSTTPKITATTPVGGLIAPEADIADRADSGGDGVHRLVQRGYPYLRVRFVSAVAGELFIKPTSAAVG